MAMKKERTRAMNFMVDYSLHFVRMIIFLSLIFVVTNLANAPAKNKFQKRELSSLASIQEKQVDEELSNYQHCYGIQMTYGDISSTRRRTCKVMLLHKLKMALSTPGTYFPQALHFKCKNIGIGFTQFYNNENTLSFKLKPNEEYKAIDLAIRNYMKKEKDIQKWIQAKQACHSYLKCQKSMKLSKLSLRDSEDCSKNNPKPKSFIQALFYQKQNGPFIADFVESQTTLTSASQQNHKQEKR